MKKRKISVSFSKNYEDVYEFLMEKPNISQFICEVMLEGKNKSLEEQVEKILDKLIAERGISTTNISSDSLNTTIRYY